MIPTTTSLMKSGWNSNLLKLFFISGFAVTLYCVDSKYSVWNEAEDKKRVADFHGETLSLHLNG